MSSKGGKEEPRELYGTPTKLFVRNQVADDPVAGEGRTESFPDQSGSPYHRRLWYVWWHLYRERGETAFVPTQAFLSPPEVDRPHSMLEQIAHLERLCGPQELELGVLRSEIDVKSLT